MLISKTGCVGRRWKEQDGSTQKLCRCKQEKVLRNNLCAAVWPRWCREGNKPPPTTNAAVSKACSQLCAIQ